MEHKFYVNALEFYRDVMKVVPELNLNQSLKLLDQSFYVGDKYYNTPFINKALESFNDLAGKEVFSVKKSSVYNEQYAIFFPNGVASLEESLDEILEEVVVDWEWVESLKSNKADKQKLDVYAEDFGVKLNQANTLANMIKAFKKEL
jgi:hypothetical protein